MISQEQSGPSARAATRSSSALAAESTAQSQAQPESQSVTQSETQSTSHWGEFFLDRLDRMVSLRKTISASPVTNQLLQRAIYSTYLDCRAWGREEQARMILGRVGAPAR